MKFKHERIEQSVGNLFLTLCFLATNGGPFVETVSAFVFESDPPKKWLKQTVSFTLYLGDADMELVDGNRSWDDVFENAAKEWNENPGIPRIVRINPRADSRPAFGNGINEVYWAEDIVEMDFENDTAAVTLSRNDALEIIETDIIFNRQLIWNSYRGLVKFVGSLQRVTDFRRVGLHELGYALGLGHPDKAGQDVLSMMNSQLSDLDRLETDDREGVRALYSNFPPERPEQLTILSIGSTAVEVSWEEVSDPEKKKVQYELSVRRSGNGDWLTIGKTEDNRTHITGLQPEVAYDLRIRSSDSQGANSAWSEFPQAWVTEAVNRPPGPPSDLIVLVTSATSVDIKWTLSADPEGDPLVYEIEIRVQDLENWLTVGTLSETSSILNGLQPDTVYDLRIRARDDSGLVGNWTVVLKAWATPVRVVPPILLVEPLDQVSFESRGVIFSAEVQGSEPLSYQWQFNGNPIIGGTSRRLVLDNLNLRDSGRYMLRIANAAGTVSTRVAILRVLKIPGSQSVLFETGFEPEENYDITVALTGQNSWQGTSAAGTGFGNEIFPDNGFQAAIGGTAPDNLDVFNGMLLWRRQNVNPVLTGWPQLLFSVDLAFLDSSNDRQDRFQWSLFDQTENRLFTVDFNLKSREISYFLDQPNQLIDTGSTFQFGRVVRMLIRMDFLSNRWDLNLGGTDILTDLPIATTPGFPSFGFMAVAWSVSDITQPGNNIMLFDNYKLTLESPVSLNETGSLEIRAVGLNVQGGFEFTVKGKAGRAFSIDKSADLILWTPIHSGKFEEDILNFSDPEVNSSGHGFYRANYKLE